MRRPANCRRTNAELYPVTTAPHESIASTSMTGLRDEPVAFLRTRPQIRSEIVDSADLLGFVRRNELITPADK
jgi:hypothetical protein